MTLRELIDRFRRDTQDLRAPYLWIDEEIIEYANEAEREACRRASLLVDSSSPITEIDISAGDSVIELDESVIYVRRAILASNQRRLVPRVARAMDEEIPGWEGNQASSPIVFVPDWESGKLKLWPPTKAADVVKTTIVRTPLKDMAKDDDTPEIPRRHHVGLLDWMKHQGYLKRDADTFDPKKASEHETRFTTEFGPPSAAIDEHWAAEQYYDIGER